MPSTQLAVIGAGPGGYTAAFRAADLGLAVTVIDENLSLGGVCLNRGCIPSKALLHAARVIQEAGDASHIGIEFAAPAIDIAKLRAWKDGIVTRLTTGLVQLAKVRKVTLIQGRAKFLGPKQLQIVTPDGATVLLDADKVILATGSRPVTLPFLPVSTRVWDSTTALALPCVPASLLVIGGGYIGLELGTVYAALGSKVTVVEALPALLSSADKDLADIVTRRLRKTFARIMCATRVSAAEEAPEGIRVTFQDDKGASTQETFTHILSSVGRAPNTAGLGLDTTSIVLTDKGTINVDSQRRTEEADIFAIGDITAGPMLAHKASFEGKVAADVAAGYAASFEPRSIPNVVFTDPELAWCGMTEQEARGKGLDIKAFKFPWAASGRAMTLGRTDGMTKIIADTRTARILGVGIAGVNAGELIAQGALAIETGMKAEDLEQTIQPHPTLSETLMETAEGLFGQPIHIFKEKA